MCAENVFIGLFLLCKQLIVGNIIAYKLEQVCIANNHVI